jgi:C-terminal processing protease CtpA/Prc
MLIALTAVIGTVPPAARGQQLSRLEKELAETMLQNVSADVHKYYFDSKLHGLDWDALVGETKQDIAKAPNMAVANAEIAALLERLNDSHTHFFPPRNTAVVDYGWRFQMFGNRCFVTEVRSKSDADTKGMRPGDEVLTIDGFSIDRASLPKLEYAMNVLTPRNRLEVDLRNPDGKIFHLSVESSVKNTAPVAGLGDSTWSLNERRMKSEDSWRKGWCPNLLSMFLNLRCGAQYATNPLRNCFIRRLRCPVYPVQLFRPEPHGDYLSLGFTLR